MHVYVCCAGVRGEVFIERLHHKVTHIISPWEMVDREGKEEKKRKVAIG
jgi:hypothetical protein